MLKIFSFLRRKKSTIDTSSKDVESESPAPEEEQPDYAFQVKINFYSDARLYDIKFDFPEKTPDFLVLLLQDILNTELRRLMQEKLIEHLKEHPEDKKVVKAAWLNIKEGLEEAIHEEQEPLISPLMAFRPNME